MSDSKCVGNEVRFSESDVLLSTTDLDSRITYANSDFCKVAGYSLEEMVGHPHNLVRHPDMPKQAFADMWQNLRAGESWMGPVKNRCKNGDYYWVNAFVTPIKDSTNKTTEYQSIRTMPDRDVVERATAEYRKINQGKSSGALKSHFDVTFYVMALLVLASVLNGVAVVASGFTLTSILPLLCLGVGFGLFALWRGKYLALVKKSQAIYDNSIMSYIYSGTNDLSAVVNLALEMQQAKLKAVIGRVNDVTEHVNESAQITVDSGKQVSQLLKDQIDETTQMAAATEEMSYTIQELAKIVEQANEASAISKEQTNASSQSVQKTIEAIHDVDKQLSIAQTELKTLVGGNEHIVKSLSDINAIAEQTNLLALNAAIEAARAGEHGRGFSVVADEVRALAARTQQSTRDIAELVANLSQSSSNAQSAMSRGIALSGQSVAQALESGQSLALIETEIERLTELNQRVMQSIEEQSSVSEQVAVGILNIKELAVSTGDRGAESQRSSEGLLNKVAEQTALIRQFS
ncbi:methyl-accepting chemotaxis protein [Shewanella marisflavi]|uniref:Chemotaxis protein n=1 Tax=Shewanella marisflavi TaxID=260364 RepID=A0AAC9TXF3_9GAMM|nr:PAS domain-containing methyl-accepting chemotaxis protein [Shewanella marisflavi]ASJ95831.1 chemotaxis protein [Shewanella marisflavi]